MSDIRITVTKDLMQKYLDKAIQMRDEAEIYVNEENQRRRDDYKRHKDALLGVIGEKPENEYFEHYKDIQVVHQEVEKVSKQPWWKFKKPKTHVEFVKKHERFYYSITSDHPIVIWEYERDNVFEILKGLPKDEVIVYSLVYKDIDDMQKSINEADGVIEVDPEYLVRLDKTYSSVYNMTGVPIYRSISRSLDAYLFHNQRKSTTTICYVDGHDMSSIEFMTYAESGYSIITKGATVDINILDKIKAMSKFHNQERLVGRSCRELMIEAGLKEDKK